jgi:hypothetical protein
MFVKYNVVCANDFVWNFWKLVNSVFEFSKKKTSSMSPELKSAFLVQTHHIHD